MVFVALSYHQYFGCSNFFYNKKVEKGGKKATIFGQNSNHHYDFSVQQWLNMKVFLFFYPHNNMSERPKRSGFGMWGPWITFTRCLISRSMTIGTIYPVSYTHLTLPTNREV